MDWHQSAHEALFIAADFRFACGERETIRLAYRTLGNPDCGTDNAILFLHGTTRNSLQYLEAGIAEPLFGPGGPLDASRHFIILPDAIGHGGSSKPSDRPENAFPAYGYADMVAAQHLVVTEALKLRRLRLVLGASMGGMQTWMWGGLYPDMMDALMPIASVPDRITGRNLLWRRLLLQIARLEETGHPVDRTPSGLGLARVLFMIIAGSPARMAESLNNADEADAYIRAVAKDTLEHQNLPDTTAEFVASWDYDPGILLSRIKAPLRAVNFADDAVNPIELGMLDRMIEQVPGGRSRSPRRRTAEGTRPSATRPHGSANSVSCWRWHTELGRLPRAA